MSAAAALLGGLAAGVPGLLVPALVRRIPEPEEPDALETDRPDPGSAHTVPAAKEPYAAIAARPGLAWKSAVAAAVVGAVVGGVLGLTWSLLVVLPLVPIGVALAVVDWRTRLLPTRVIAPTYGLVVVTLLVVWAVTGATDDLLRAGVGWLALGGLFLVLWFVHPAGLGYGDVRLSGILGLALGHLGWGELVVGGYAGFLLGGFGGLLLTRLGVVDRKENPFGPWMLLGAVLGIVWGPAVLEWLFGSLVA